MHEESLNSDSPVSTYYAPAERATPAEVESASTLVNHHPFYDSYFINLS